MLSFAGRSDQMSKDDIKLKTTNSLEWNQFVLQKVEIALPLIYQHALDFSESAREWYWTSIKSKRQFSTFARVISYALAVVGVAGPLLAATRTAPEAKVVFTQAGITSLAVAGAILLCDTVFGWSSGWLRYVTTVTAMERLTLQFQLDWASYCLARTEPLTDADRKPLFDVAKALELEIDKRRGEETDGWVAEFNRGMAALNEMIKFQKDATEQAAAKARASMEEKFRSQNAGGIELSVLRPADLDKAIKIFLDGNEVGTLNGSSWGKTGITPGMHTVRLALEGTSLDATRIAQVPPGEILKLEFKFP
jgi:SMODS and SLOG-associating 2TM effector domain 2